MNDTNGMKEELIPTKIAETEVLSIVVTQPDEKKSTPENEKPVEDIKPRESLRNLSQIGTEIAVNEPKQFNGHRRRSSLPINPTQHTQDLLGVGEIVPMNRAVSLDTGINQEETKDGSGILSVKQMSFEVLIEENHKAKRHNKEEVHKEEIPVPPRDVLLRMPLYSTPLTLEATNNAYRDFIARLIGMGFELAQAECAVTMTNAETMEGAVEFVFQHPDGLWHRFRPNEKTITEMGKKPEETYKFQREDLCELCGLQYWRHFLDPNGDKIEVSSLEQEIPSGDMQSRVTISIATRNEREEFKRELEQRVILLNASNRNAGAGSATTTSTTNPTIVALLQEEANRPKPVGPTQLCGICFEEKPEDSFYRAPCGHNYCMECLETHYRIKTQDADVLKVGCIDPNCDREIPEEEFTKFLRDPELLKKFRTFKKNKLLMLNPNARFCLRPDCEGHMVGSRWQPKLVCPECSTAQCFNCNQGWHGYLTGCNSNNAIGDLSYHAWAINKNVQRCPKCRVTIEKSEGCNHMTCSSCHYEFCWICRGPYNGAHFEWWNIFGCPGAQFTPQYCRCPACFPRWLNRVLIMICFLAVVVPLGIAAGILWMIVMCFLFCFRCNKDCGSLDPCDCVD